MNRTGPLPISEVDAEAQAKAQRSPPDAPALSAIIISRDDEATIARSVASVVYQECPEPFEIIVVTSGADRTAAVVREQFPQVQLLELPRPALPGEACNAGLRAAHGTYVTFPGSHTALSPGSLAARLEAHRRGYTMVTGATLNGTFMLAGWASYFLDHARNNLPGHPAGVLDRAPVQCSYDRAALLSVGGFPEGVRTAEDTAVNEALFALGHRAYRDPRVQFIHYSPCRTPMQLVRHHFTRGRGWGRLLVQRYGSTRGLLNREVLWKALLRYVPGRLARITFNVLRWGPEDRPIYFRAFPLVAAGAISSWLGMWYEVTWRVLGPRIRGGQE